MGLVNGDVFTMKNPFRRRENQTIAELESYYATQGKSQGRGRAWLMALMSLIVTVIVVAGLFFAARWVYRAVTDNSSESEVTTGSTEGDGTVTVITDGSSDPRSSEDVVAGVLNQAEDTDNPGDGDVGSDSNSETEEGGVVSDEAASTTRDVAGDSATDSSLSTSDDLPNTGAGETVALILLTTVVIGYAVSRRFQVR